MALVKDTQTYIHTMFKDGRTHTYIHTYIHTGIRLWSRTHKQTYIRHMHSLAGFLVGREHSAPSSVHPLDDQMIQHHFLLGLLYDVLLNTVLRHQAVDVHLFKACQQRLIQVPHFMLTNAKPNKPVAIQCIHAFM